MKAITPYSSMRDIMAAIDPADDPEAVAEAQETVEEESSGNYADDPTSQPQGPEYENGGDDSGNGNGAIATKKFMGLTGGQITLGLIALVVIGIIVTKMAGKKKRRR